jgi:hypothetical protein
MDKLQKFNNANHNITLGMELEYVKCMVEMEPQLKFGAKNSRGRDNLEDLDLNVRIVML